jgi:SIR2-like domain
MTSLPLGLRQVLQSGDCVLFIGAGVGAHLKRSDGTAAPDSRSLAKDMCSHFGVPESEDLAKVAQFVEIKKGRTNLEGYVKKVLADLEPDETFQWLTTFGWRAIFTTNYDRSILRAYELNGDPPQIPVPMSVTADLQYTDPRIHVPVFYLHGTLFGENASHIVITQEDYSRFQAKRKMVWSRLKTEFATSTILYLGYSGKDPNWQLVLDEVEQEFYPSHLPQSYRTDPYADPIDVEILQHRHIETLKTDLSGFQAMVRADLGDFRPDPEALKKYRKDVPTDLLDAFEKNPAATLKLLTSWEYVNGANFHDQPNTKQFLRGDPPSWSLVGADVHFRRDIEDDVWDEVLEFATDTKAKSKAIAVVAPAGYGVTTELMSLAAKIVKERIGPVFRLRTNGDVSEGDVAFAASLFPDVSTFFVVDQAREQAIALNTAISQQKTNCLFLLGERKSEWHTARVRMRVNEFEILPLSDSEIDRLLDYLSREGALGKLGELDRSFQVAAVKERHEKQLLVAMREVIEDARFDAIIEDEYRGIEDKSSKETSTGKDFYLLTACFYQHGLAVRDDLAAQILDKPLQDIFAEVADSLDGIVTSEEFDVARGEFASRTRHRVIAEVVWKRCGEIGLKERMLHRAMELLNFTYRLDKAIFEKFVRRDEVVESFRTLEGKTKFFETACKREPDNPYVLQHFARMLLREKKANLALSQIDAAIKMNGSLRVLHHTRGTVLAELAISAESEEIGRKWMIQSEHEFQQCIAMNDKDHYGYQGLAQLYLDWAKRVKGEDESSDYLTKSEQIISEGLRLARERETLWVVSAMVQKFLGNSPGQIKKLQNALSEKSDSVIPRYLLGRAYRDSGQPQKCIEVLDPLVKKFFKEFRAFVEYVRAMLELGEPYAKCAALLSQAQLDGATDPTYVALLGGLLVMDQKPGEAQKIFAETTRQGFSYEERIAAHFRPRDLATNARLRLPGRVTTVKAGYVFIQSDQYNPDFRAGTTRVKGTILQRGAKVTFSPGFTAAGPIAERVELE